MREHILHTEVKRRDHVVERCTLTTHSIAREHILQQENTFCSKRTHSPHRGEEEGPRSRALYVDNLTDVVYHDRARQQRAARNQKKKEEEKFSTLTTIFDNLTDVVYHDRARQQRAARHTEEKK